jgi:hypothetical protein
VLRYAGAADHQKQWHFHLNHCFKLHNYSSSRPFPETGRDRQHKELTWKSKPGQDMMLVKMLVLLLPKIRASAREIGYKPSLSAFPTSHPGGKLQFSPIPAA